MTNAKNAIAAIRVSSTRQGIDGDSPEAQKEQIERFAANRGWAIKKFFVFLESASKEQQPMQEAIDYCKERENGVDCFIIKSIDRFTRGGSLSYDLLKTQLEVARVKLVDIHGIISSRQINTLDHLGVAYKWSVYSPSKKSEILEAERSKDELRDIMTRMVGAEIRYTRLGYWMRMPPYGYISRRVETAHGKRTVLEPHPTESEYIITIFKLRASGKYTDEEIAQKINNMGYRGHTKRSLRLRRSHNARDDQRTQMTAKHMWRLVRHPIYAGINNEKWTDGKPVKCAFDGLVSIDLFNQANKGHRVITDYSGGKITVEDFSEPRYTDKGRRSAEFPYKKFVLCPECKKPLYGSASRGKSGKLYPAYHCSRQGHRFRISKQELESQVNDFVGNLKLDPKLADQYIQIANKSWQKLHNQYGRQVDELDERIVNLRGELDATVQKIKVLSSETAIKCLEEELVRLEKEIGRAELQKQQLTTKKPRDLKEIARKLKHVLEHFDQAVKEQMDPIKKAKLFSLLFDHIPTYKNLAVGAAGGTVFTGVSPLFTAKSVHNTSSGASGGIRTPDTRFRRPVL